MEPELPPARNIRGACPLDCPDTCSWIVTVKHGEAAALRGDPDHPYTRGSLCNKVADYLNYARSPERVLYPMRQVGPKGSGQFIRISWEEALEIVAARLRDVIATHGAEAIWPFLGSGNMGLIQGAYGAGRRFWNVLGASRHVQTICTIAGGFGTGYTLGDNRVGMDPQTFKFSNLVVLWGANVLSTHPHLWRSILHARNNGASVVSIDPVRTRTAAASDWHLAPIPGTDAALALGLLHVVLAEGREDREFIGERTVGWELFRQRILDFPPSRAAEITGLSPESIIELGKRLADTRPTGIRIGIGIQRHGGGGMAVRTRQLLESGHSSVAGITLEALKERGSIRLKYPDPFVPFATTFPTASGKLEFVSERMAKMGLDPVAGYTPSNEAVQRDTTLALEYPLVLLTPANHYFLNSIFANVPRQLHRSGAPTLLIHPDDAAPRRIETGEEVRVANARGSFVAVAEVSDRVRPGVVASTKGHWPRNSKDGATVNATVDERDSDMGGGAVYHDNRVRVDKSA